MEFVYLILFATLLSVANAQYPWPLLCPPKPPTVTPFDPERVRGTLSYNYSCLT